MNDFSVNDLIGKPFKDVDRCFGLVREVFRRQGKEIPDYGEDVGERELIRIDGIIRMLAMSDDWTEIKKPVRGCLIVLRFPYPKWVSHVGVMLDPERFINARKKTGVIIDRITSPAWKYRIAGFYEYRSQEKGERKTGFRVKPGMTDKSSRLTPNKDSG